MLRRGSEHSKQQTVDAAYILGIVGKDESLKGVI